MNKRSAYHSMKAHELARVTRERGLEKPKVITLSEWADFLDKDDAKRLNVSKAVDVTKADTDEQAADMPDAQTDETPKERAQDKKKGK